jgi:hypothetical protein
VILPTDLPAGPAVVVPLELLDFNDWSRPHCS